VEPLPHRSVARGISVARGKGAQSGFGGGSAAMYSIFYIIGVVIVILAVLSLLGIR
jgi:hypothetical protein